MAVAAPICLFADGTEVFREAERLFSDGQYRSAIERYDAVAEEYPDSQLAGTAKLRSGQSLYFLGRYDAARLTLERTSLRFFSDAVQQNVHYWLGLTLFALKDFEGAERAFTRHLEGGGPEGVRARFYRALSLRERGKLSAAEADLLSVLGTDVHASGLVSLFAIYSQAGESRKIVDAWRRSGAAVDRSGPYREVSVRFAADAAFAEGEYDLAVELYEELTSGSLDNAQWAFYRLTVVLGRLGRSDRDVYRRAEQRLSAEPHRLVEFWLALGIEAFENERFQVAELYLVRLWEARSERAVPGQGALYLAYALEAQARRDEAIAVLKGSLETASSHEVERRIYLGELLLSAGAAPEAVEAMRDTWEGGLFAGHAAFERAAYTYASALTAQGDPGTALKTLDDPALTPLVVRDHEITRLRAWLLESTDRSVEAVRAYRDFLGLRPGDETARLGLIRALVSAGESDAALREFGLVGEKERTGTHHLYAGLAYFSLTRYPEAHEEFETARLLGISGAVLDYHGMWAAFRTADNGAVLAAAARLIDSQAPPEVTFDAAYLTATIHQRAGRPGQSIDALLQILGLPLATGQIVQARTLLAAAYLEAGQSETALAQYRTLLSLAQLPDAWARTWRDYAALLADTGELDQAEDELRRLNSRLSATAAGRDALLDLGALLFRRERYGDARDAYRAFRSRYRTAPGADEALFWAGESSLRLGEPAAALLWWEPLVADYPESAYAPRTYLGMANILEERGQLRRALELAERLRALHPESAEAGEAALAARRWRLELDGFSRREAALWARLEETRPVPGGDAWFDLVLELARIIVREQITLSGSRGAIVDYLRSALDFPEHPGSAEAGVLLGEYYERQSEYRSALEAYLRVAENAGAGDDRRAESLYRVAAIAATHLEDGETADRAALRLEELFPDSIWSQRIRGER